MLPTPQIEVFRPDELRMARSVVAVGAFDGVHLGHQSLLSGAANRAAALGIPAVAYTFDPPPRSHFEGAIVLTPLPEKLGHLADLGISHAVVAPFGAQYAARGPERLVDELTDLGAVEIWVGSDFRFGNGRSGSTETLRRSFDVNVVPTVLCAEDRPISSSRVRELLAAGAYQRAGDLLGRQAVAQ